MSVNNVVSMAGAVEKRNERISNKVNRLVYIHNQINILENNLKTLEGAFAKAFSNKSCYEMGYIAREIYNNCTKLDGLREYEKLVLSK